MVTPSWWTPLFRRLSAYLRGMSAGSPASPLLMGRGWVTLLSDQFHLEVAMTPCCIERL